MSVDRHAQRAPIETLPNLPPHVGRVIEVEKFDAAFEKWRQQNPEGSFSQFSAEKVSAALDRGVPHATLGLNLKNGSWEDHGLPVANTIESLTRQVTGRWDTSLKVCDYGCGSLRVGRHFIQRQEPGCYAGIDVTEDFIDRARPLLAEEIAAKQPVVGTIAGRIDEVEGMGIDVLFSHNVYCHIHPDEVDTYFDNIKRIVHKPGSVAIIQALCSQTPLRHQKSGWAWPLDFVLSKMLPLTRPKNSLQGSYEKDGIKFESHLITFVRQAPM